MKHSYAIIAVSLASLFPKHTLCPPPDSPGTATIRHLRRPHRIRPEQMRERLRECLMGKDLIPQHELRDALDLLFECGPPSTLTAHNRLFFQTVEHLHGTPGLQSTIGSALFGSDDMRPNRRYFVWILACAMHYAPQETIVAFNRSDVLPDGEDDPYYFGLISQDKTRREIWSKCKTSSWNGSPHQSPLARQLIRQKEVVQNARTDDENRRPLYRICSKETPPEEWRKWLKGHYINVAVITPQSLEDQQS